jgi:cell division septum initiation protein DivIVA
MSAEDLSPKRRPPADAADAAQRLARIVDAAEQAAAGVIDDAEEQARQTLEQAQERADRIVAERLRELADELDRAGGGERRGGHLRPVEAAAGDRPEEDYEDEQPLAPRRSASAGARLLATQMAVSGAGRGEIEERLRDGFQIDDTSEILDAILGPEE